MMIPYGLWSEFSRDYHEFSRPINAMRRKLNCLNRPSGQFAYPRADNDAVLIPEDAWPSPGSQPPCLKKRARPLASGFIIDNDIDNAHKHD